MYQLASARQKLTILKNLYYYFLNMFINYHLIYKYYTF